MRIRIVLFSRGQQKTKFLIQFFCLLLFEGTFTSFFKDKKSKRSHKTLGIKVFLLYLLDDRRIRMRIYRILMFLGLPDPDPPVRSMDPDTGGPKTLGSGGSSRRGEIGISETNQRIVGQVAETVSI
jgi:hypothetical protein